MQIEIYGVGEKVQHAEHGVGVVRQFSAIQVDTYPLRRAYTVRFEDKSRTNIEHAELTPIEPEPALDARARELIAEKVAEGNAHFCGKLAAKGIDPWMCVGASACDKCVPLDPDNPKSVAAVRAHLAAQEKEHTNQ